MKAAERIKRYGMEKYAKTCLHKEVTPELITTYKEKYGEGIIEGETWKYTTTHWKFNAEHEDGRKRTVEGKSDNHHIPDKERDKEEAWKKVVRDVLKESGWFYSKARQTHKTTMYRAAKYETMIKPTEQAKIPTVKEALEEKPQVIKESLQEKRTSIAKAMKEAGYNALETAKALMEV